MGSDNLFTVCATCGIDIPKSAKICSKCGSKQKRLSALQWVGISVGVLIFIGLILPETENKNTTNSSSSYASSSTKTGQTLNASLPADQAEFVDIVMQSAQRYANTNNELEQWSFRDDRKHLLQNSQIRKSVTNWIGSIKQLSTNMDGNAVLTIRISPDIEIGTWDNAFSDFGSNTLIDKGSRLYSDLMDLSAGRQVKFSGSFFLSDEDCFEVTNLTQRGAMTSPDFLFRFAEIKSVD